MNEKNEFDMIISDDNNGEQDVSTNEYSTISKKRKRGKRRSKKNAKDVNTNNIYMYS